jgi:protein-disulfide isomerase-like protein with CxxC motif
MFPAMSTTPTITLEWVREQKAVHRQALADLEATERVLLSKAAETKDSVPMVAAIQAAVSGYGAKKRAFLTAIAATTHGLTTQGVITACESGGMTGLKPENTSPQLSSYKGDGLLDLKEGLWRITAKGRDFLAAKG